MTTPAVVALVLVGAVVAWKVGSVALRLLGVLLILAGVVNLLVDGQLGLAVELGLVVLGFVLWLVGHWLFAFRHHKYRSSLAQRIFMQVLPGELEPTRRWRASAGMEAEQRR